MPKNLLLADDSITIQKVVGITFAGEDFTIVTVDNGDDALARAREVPPDVILADVVMPRRNGYELCEAIKSDPGLKHIPVLLLAGTFEAFDEARARAAGADAHIAKPFDSQALINKVKDLVAGSLSRENQASAGLGLAAATAARTRLSSDVETAPFGIPHVGDAPAARAPASGPAGPQIRGVRTSSIPPPVVPRAPLRAAPPQPASPPPSAGRAPSEPIGASHHTVTATAPRSSSGSQPAVVKPEAQSSLRRPIELDWSDLGFADPAAISPAPQPRSSGPVVPPLSPSASQRPGLTTQHQVDDSLRQIPPAPASPGGADVMREFGAVVRAPTLPNATNVQAPPAEARLDRWDNEPPELLNDDSEPLPLGEPIDLAELQSDEASDVPGPALEAAEPGPIWLAADRAGTIAGEAKRRADGDIAPVTGSLGNLSGTVSREDLSGTGAVGAGLAASPAADGGEAQLREALSRASREVIERIAWEIVPPLAESIIREHIERLVKERQQ